MDSVGAHPDKRRDGQQAKDADRLAQRERSQYRRSSFSCRECRGSRRKGMDLTHSGMETKHGKPISLPASGKHPAREADGGVGTGTWKKRRLLCNGGDRG
jgi:hypothetical protein